MQIGEKFAVALRLVGISLVVSAATLPAMADDHPNTCDQASHWPVSGSRALLQGTIDAPGDVDALSLELEPGAVYRFDIWSGEGSGWARARIIAPGCTAARAEWLPWEPSARYWFMAPPADPATGTTPRLVALIDAPFGGAGEYRIPIERVGGPFTDDFPSTQAEAKVILADGRDISGTLEFGYDQDVFAIHAQPGVVYRLQVVEGLDQASKLRATIAAPHQPNTPITLGQVPAEGCNYSPQGCSIAHVIAPSAATGAPSILYITVQNGYGDDETAPARSYRFRVGAESDVVNVAGAAACEGDELPAMPMGQVVLLNPPQSTWHTRSFAATVTPGHVYRMHVESAIGQPHMFLSVSGWDCMDSLAWIDPWDPRPGYFRAPSDGRAKFITGRQQVRFDPWEQPVLGAWLVRIEDLGSLQDDHPDVPLPGEPTLPAGGVLVRGLSEHGGDVDVLTTELAAGVRYRVEARASMNSAILRVAALALQGPGSTSFNLGEASTGGFSGREFELAAGGRVMIEVRRTASFRTSLPEPQATYELRIVRAGCRGDWNGSGSVDADDLYGYLADYFDGRGEFDGLGSAAGVGDLFAFVRSWLGPCQ